jgi:predicted dehydrogenase
VDFYTAVAARRDGRRDTDSTFATFADGHRTTRLVEAIVESHREGAWVAVLDHDKAPA